MAMIESKHEVGSDGWYDDLSAVLLARGEIPTEEVITLEVARIEWEEKIVIRPDTRRSERWAREEGLIPEGMSFDEWIESMKPEFFKRWPDLAEVKVGPKP
jgi:hypothetical protein